MVVYCTVCINNTRHNKNISYFNYPKEYNRRQYWLKAVRREDLLLKLVDDKARQQYRICEEHFERNCIKYSKNRTVKYLFDFAFPTLKLPSNEGASSSSIQENAIPTDNLPSNTDANLNQFENVTVQENQEILLPTSAEPPSNSNNFLNTIVKLEDTSLSIKTESDIQICTIEDVKSLQTALHLAADPSRKSKLALEFQEAEKNKNTNLDNVTKEDFLKLCDKFMTKSMSQIIKWQMEVKAGCSGNRHSLAFKLFALNLYYSGPAVYRFLTNTLCLPSLLTLQNLVTPIGTKTDERLLCALKAKVNKMGSQEKICSICVDCMSLKPNLYYDIRNDRIVGLHEINGIQKKEPAKYVIVMMIRGITHNWKHPIAHSFVSQCKNYPEVNEWIDEIIISLLNIGLDIRVFVSNLGSDFIKAAKLRSVSSDKTYFEVNGHKIFYMFDVPHLIKCVRNNFKTCNFNFDGKVAKWSYIKDLYNQDKSRQIRLAPKLTDVHINPNNFQEMRVNLAIQVLSRTVASAINTYVDLNLIDVAAKDTAVFINKINNLFDILNSNTLRSPNKFKRAFRGDKYQIDFLQEMLSFFKNLNLIRIDGQKDVTDITNFINGFEVSIKSLLQLSEDLKSEGITFILTRRLNQDVIENFFGKVRQASGNCQEPTCQQLSKAFKKIFVTNILRIPQNTNCDQDFDSLLMKQEDCRVFDTPSQVSLDPQPYGILAVGTTDYRFDLPEKNALVYVSCYLYRKCLQQHKCEKIKQYVKRSEQPIMGKDSDQKNLNDGNVQLDFLIIPPDHFIVFVGLLEKKFREYFDLEINMVNVGNEILKRIKDCIFDMPCECFPLHYLKKLYVRFRIYHTIKRNNKLFKKKDYKRKIFRVSNL